MIWATGWVEPASTLAMPSNMPILAAATTAAGRSSYCVSAMNRARSSVVPIFAPRADDRGHPTTLCRALTLRNARWVPSYDVNEQTDYARTPCFSMTTSSSPQMVSEVPNFLEAAISVSISSRSSVADRISVSLALLWRTGTHVTLTTFLSSMVTLASRPSQLTASEVLLLPPCPSLKEKQPRP